MMKCSCGRITGKHLNLAVSDDTSSPHHPRHHKNCFKLLRSQYNFNLLPADSIADQFNRSALYAERGTSDLILVQR